MPRKPTGNPPGRPRKPQPPAVAPVEPADSAVGASADLCAECWPLGWSSVHKDHDAVACIHGHYERDDDLTPEERAVLLDQDSIGDFGPATVPDGEDDDDEGDED